MNVRWTLYALEDLNDIENYISLDDPETAVEFVNELICLGDSLQIEKTAKRGTKALWADDDAIREIYYKGYTLVYEITENGIVIHEVFNQKRVYIRSYKRQ